MSESAYSVPMGKGRGPERELRSLSRQELGGGTHGERFFQEYIDAQARFHTSNELKKIGLGEKVGLRFEGRKEGTEFEGKVETRRLSYDTAPSTPPGEKVRFLKTGCGGKKIKRDGAL